MKCSMHELNKLNKCFSRGEAKLRTNVDQTLQNQNTKHFLRNSIRGVFTVDYGLKLKVKNDRQYEFSI